MLVLGALALKRTLEPPDDASLPAGPSVRVGLVVELGLCLAVAALAVGADHSAVKAAGDAISGASRDPWSSTPGFSPLRAEGPQHGYEPWVLLPDRLTSPSGAVIERPFSPEGLAQLEPHLKPEPSVEARDEEMEKLIHPERKVLRRFSVAVDSRVATADFAKLLPTLRAQGIGRVEVVGKLATPPAVSGGSVWWLGLLGSSGAEELELYPEDAKPVKVVKPDQLDGLLDDASQRLGLELTSFGLQGALDAAKKLRTVALPEPVLVGPDGVAPAPAEEDEEAGEAEDDEGGVAGGLGSEADEPDEDDEAEVGALQRQQVADTVHKGLTGFKFCYERELRVKPGLEGKVVVQFTIAASGAVKEANVASSTANDAKLESCLVERMKKLRFPPPKGGDITVNYPFIFKPG